MKKNPIRIEKAGDSEYKIVEWKLHNVCNHKCSYCGEENKDGSNRWKSLETYKQYFDNLHRAANGAPLWVQLTGGEPTLFPELLELMKYIKQKGTYLSMITNGSRTIRWWKETRDARVLDMLVVTYHPEQTNDYHHIIEVLNLFQDEPTETLCKTTHSKGLLDRAFADTEYITNNTGAMTSVGHMIINDYDIYASYTPEQFEKLKQVSMVRGKFADTKKETSVPFKHRYMHLFINVTFDDNTVEEMRAQLFMKNYKPEFKNWRCANGKYIMKLENDLVYRGICGVGEITSINDPKLQFNEDYITCTKNTCDCRLDLTSTRYLKNDTD